MPQSTLFRCHPEKTRKQEKEKSDMLEKWRIPLKFLRTIQNAMKGISEKVNIYPYPKNPGGAMSRTSWCIFLRNAWAKC